MNAQKTPVPALVETVLLLTNIYCPFYGRITLPTPPWVVYCDLLSMASEVRVAWSAMSPHWFPSLVDINEHGLLTWFSCRKRNMSWKTLRCLCPLFPQRFLTEALSRWRWHFSRYTHDSKKKKSSIWTKKKLIRVMGLEMGQEKSGFAISNKGQSW